MRTSTPSRAAPLSASTSDGDGVKYAVAIQIERSAEIAWICSARETRSRSGSPSMMPTSAGSSVGGIEVRAARRPAQKAMRAAALVARRRDATCGRTPAPCRARPALRSCTAVSRQRERCVFSTPVVHSRPTPTPPVMPTRRVDDEQLAVVARHEAEPARETRAG